jgi:long-subunit acyl-CoA synthetase (AMP-forming)
MKVNGEVTSISCPPAPDDIGIIMYTSGSTGKPKVRLSLNFYQCCGSGIRCLFDPCIRDLGWVKNQDPDPG